MKRDDTTGARLPVESAPGEQTLFFCAEAMTPLMRVGVFLGALFSAGLIACIVIALAIWPEGLFSVSELLAAETIGVSLAQTFVMVLVYGGLLSNNDQISQAERKMWYVAFLFPGPFAMPFYWIMYVRTAPYLRADEKSEPEVEQGNFAPALLASAHAK